MGIEYVVTQSGSISAIVGNSAYVVQRDHPNYGRLSQAARNGDENEFLRLVDIPKTIERYAEGNVVVEHGLVKFRGEPVHNTLTQRILDLMNNGLPVAPLVRFLENLMQNPSKRAVQELYSFLEHKGLPITEDGCYLAYKRVRQDWLDCHSKRYSNHIGATLTMPRNQVDDNWGVDCSQGFHVGCMAYVGNFRTDGRILIVKINPKNAVSVPSSESTKMRVSEYTVVREFDRELERPLYYPDATPVESSQNFDNPWHDTANENDWFDEENYDDDDSL